MLSDSSVLFDLLIYRGKPDLPGEGPNRTVNFFGGTYYGQLREESEMKKRYKNVSFRVPPPLEK